MDGQVQEFISPSINGTMIILGIGASEVAITPFLRQLVGQVGGGGQVGAIVNSLVYIAGSMIFFNFAAHQRGLVQGLLVGVGADMGFRGIEQILNLVGIAPRIGASFSF